MYVYRLNLSSLGWVWTNVKLNKCKTACESQLIGKGLPYISFPIWKGLSLICHFLLCGLTNSFASKIKCVVICLVVTYLNDFTLACESLLKYVFFIRSCSTTLPIYFVDICELINISIYHNNIFFKDVSPTILYHVSKVNVWLYPRILSFIIRYTLSCGVSESVHSPLISDYYQSIMFRYHKCLAFDLVINEGI